MARPKKSNFVVPAIYNKFDREDHITLPDGNVIRRGDKIKIRGKNSYGVGEWGITFKFDSLITNTDTGVQWIDCFELHRGQAGCQRSFYPERIKRIPTKRRRRVNRATNS